MNIQNGNILIAMYMGAKYWPKSKNLFVKYSDAYELENNGVKVAFGATQLKYHYSFDWLIPVERKIYTTGDKEMMDNLTRKFDHWEINKLWAACVNYILWHNSNNTP